jgi:predicted Zn finger-like uncharacterized protein
MYTQCPECEIAFRVTADVLKQAAGMVRCGGCSHAFNALAFLSETMPQQTSANSARAVVPELKPEIIETQSRPPKSISAEQSAALLKTLDELAGSNIRIEDTGVEWRVLDEDEASEPAADDDFANVEDHFEIEVQGEPEPEAEESDEQTPVDELRFDDNTPLPDDFDLGDEPAPPEPAPATEEAAPSKPVFMPAEPQAELALTEPDEWTDLLGEFEDLAEEVAAPVIDTADELEATDDAESNHDAPMDMDTQFALQAEAMGIDVSGVHEVDDESADDIAAALEQDLEEELADDREDAQEFQLEAELDALDDDSDDELDELDDELRSALNDGSEQFDFGDELTYELNEDKEDEIEEDIEDAFDDALEDERDDKLAEEILEDDLAELEAESRADDDDEPVQHVIPPMSDEEHTVNMQIDQDLMSLAIEDEDGFASTIIIPDGNFDQVALDAREQDDDTEADDTDTPPGFETIIMEGESIRSALDDEKREADIAAAAALAELAAVDEAKKAELSGRSRYGMIGGIVVLVLLLAVQMIHQSREALATIPAFSSTVGQIYRAIGQPVQPAWDITAWRIEASDDTIAADEGTENLTVYSRIGNTSDRAMPYPLISISLTDRYLEPIGSQILDPADYLPSDLDPRKHVEPGNTFNAVMSIQSPSIEATGYKLDVCYRLSDGRLRCAIDDFK